MGRKRHIVVYTLGLVLAVLVHAADIQDRDGARLVLEMMRNRFPRLVLIWADGGYAGKLVVWVQETLGWMLEIVKRSDDMTGFVVLPNRDGLLKEHWVGWDAIDGTARIMNTLSRAVRP